MLLKSLIIFAFLAFVTAKSDDVTFKNVAVSGYSMFTYKFNVTIENSNSLKNNLPKKVFDKIEIVGNKIPVLYENSIADIDNLDELIMNNNEILEIRRGAFKNVPLLRKLEITNNKLEQIREGVFNELNVGTLDLSKNSINTIAPGAFDNMSELLNINLGENQLKIWNKNWFANTPLLTRVSLQNNFIEEIPAEAFRNFEGEKQFGSVSLTINIILSHNKIKTIHQNAFKGLSKINNLWLDYNEIDTWNENLLTGIALKDLRLDQNKLQCLTQDFKKIFVADTTHIDGNPWDCGCLKNIEVWATEHGKNVIMAYSKITCDAERIEMKLKNLNKLLKELKKNDNVDDTVPALSVEFFKNLHNVTTLILSSDEIEEIEPGTFAHLSQLKVLHISYNKLSEIREGIFNHLKLTTLNLDGNGITNIAPGAFDDMVDLIGISITQNPLSYWNPHWLTNTPSLIVVNMKYNRIEELGPDSFKNFQGERTLTVNFDHNKIRTINGDAFRGITRITRLSFNHNQLEILNGSFLQGVRIQQLHISHNRIRCVDDDDFSRVFVANVTYVEGNPWDCDCLRKSQVIPVLSQGSIANIDDMRSLRLYDDNIKEVQPGAFQNLPNLETLEIYWNKVEKIQAGVFNDLNLKNLDISANKISSIAPDAFDNMTSLEFINLANNKLTRLNIRWFAKTPSLRNIHISYNLLEEIPANAFGEFKKIQSDADSSPFNIFLEGNIISKIDDDAFKSLKKITVLSLSSNSIETLNGNFLSDLEIDELYLNSNKIQCLDEENYEKIFVAKHTQIIYNPMNTTCLESIEEWAKNHQKDVKTFQI
ncbi:phospholipase A2 inhibitor-like [Asbolus verrucosus]|uniref:Phospholipase A2 inhibitor-like n=1 Tax=Asbolus verrucosus TaxID=1661398 RepID=A0A482VZM4_ASBVE|nr:phospholipase A2 inhibitor-like [Asbolus verrucosus]